MLDSATGGHWAPSSHDVAISPSPSFGEYELEGAALSRAVASGSRDLEVATCRRPEDR
jgi:hypothetical protein